MFVTCLIQLFAYAAQEHSTKYGSTLEQCAKIACKNHKHSVHNPYACLRKEIPFKYISESKTICKPITLAMSAPTADGSAAAVVCSRAFMESRGMQVSFQTGSEIFNTMGTKVFFSRAAIGCFRPTRLRPTAETENRAWKVSLWHPG